MYPELTPPLAVLVLGTVLIGAGLAVRQPVLRRLAFRQLARRPVEAALVIVGSVLGTALIVASLAVGDSFDSSIRAVAVRVLGPIDERITSVDPERGAAIADAITGVEQNPAVDGVLTVRHDQATASSSLGGHELAEPVALVWEVDLDDAARFGGTASGLAGPTPVAGEVVVNRVLADSLALTPGDELTLYLYGSPTTMRVARVIDARGLGGMGLGATQNADVFVAPGTLTASATAAGAAPPLTTTLVSNRGGVEAGADRTDEVVALLRSRLGPLADSTTVVEAKREVLEEAETTSSMLGSLFLMISSFTIIAGVLLLLNVFVMLAEDRKGQLGMLRAVGLTRARLVEAFALEGAAYAAVAGTVGVVVGIGVGRAVVVVAERVMNGWDTGGQRLSLDFSVSTVSLWNGFAIGFLISVTAVVLTSVRISRLNIIAAIRDLPGAGVRGLRARWVRASTIAAVVVAALAVPTVAASAAIPTYVLPPVALFLLVPWLLQRFPSRRVWTGVSGAALTWGLLANVVRPAVFDDASTSVYVVLGVLVTFSAVLLVSVNQAVVLRPLQWWMDRPTQNALSARLAVAYPTARGFRTGATLAMYSLVVFVVVLLTQISAILDASVSSAVADAGGGWTHRVDVNPAAPLPDGASTLGTGAFADGVAEVAELVLAPARATDPAGGDGQLDALAVGLGDDVTAGHPIALDRRLEGLSTDAEVWRAVQADSRLVVVDRFFGSEGGPQGERFAPGDTFQLTDPDTGATRTKTIAGVLANASAFYGVGVGELRYPVLMAADAVSQQFERTAAPTSYLLAARPGVDPQLLASRLQGELLSSGVVAVEIAARVEQDFSASRSFFRMMQGFLALGLLVGITGLGVVMVRAVRERRRTIGVLRALGFQARAVQRAFMAESTFVAVEGIVIGASLAIVTTWLLYQNSAAFSGLRAPYPVAWRDVAAIMTVTFLCSILTTLGPARRAARIRPAIAVRVAN